MSSSKWQQGWCSSGRSYHAGGGTCRMWTYVGVSEESFSPPLPAGCLINQSQSKMVQPVRISVPYIQIRKTFTQPQLQLQQCLLPLRTLGCVTVAQFDLSLSWWFSCLLCWMCSLLCVWTGGLPVAFVAPQPVVIQDQLLSRSSSSSGTQTGDTLEPVDQKARFSLSLGEDLRYCNTPHTGHDTLCLSALTESGGHAEAEQRHVRFWGKAAILWQIEDLVHWDSLRRGEAEVMDSQNHHILFSSAGIKYSQQEELKYYYNKSTAVDCGPAVDCSTVIFYLTMQHSESISCSSTSTWRCSVWRWRPTGGGSALRCSNGVRWPAGWPARARRRDRTRTRSPQTPHHPGTQREQRGLEPCHSWSSASYHTCPLSSRWGVDRITWTPVLCSLCSFSSDLFSVAGQTAKTDYSTVWRNNLPSTGTSSEYMIFWSSVRETQQSVKHLFQVNTQVSNHLKPTQDIGDPLSVLLDFGVDSRSSGSSTTDSPTHQTSQLIPTASEAGQRTSRVPLRTDRTTLKMKARIGQDILSIWIILSLRLV